MLKRHEAIIRNRFDELKATGKTEFDDKWLLNAFSAERMGKRKVWDSLFAYLPEEIDKNDLWLFRRSEKSMLLHDAFVSDVAEMTE
jgi:hypothetical protein